MRPNPPVRTPSRAFTLLEMLVVMAILVIVISIVIPTLGTVRTAARRSATQSLMASLGTASNAFKLDNNRAPGYFSPRDMGNANNPGLSGMNNVLIDLAGAIDASGSTANGNGDACDPVAGITVVKVGPISGEEISIDTTRVGSGDKKTGGGGYFRADAKTLVRQCQNNQKKAGTPNQYRALPDLVDAWGTPILAWSEDSLPAGTTTFASEDASSPAHFYRQSNAVFLQATSLGKMAIDQTDPGLGSLLGSSSTNPASRTTTLTALLGNPAFSEGTGANAMPTASRSALVFHSAGANGTYLGKTERAAKAAGGSAIQYRPNADPFENGQSDDLIIKAD